MRRPRRAKREPVCSWWFSDSSLREVAAAAQDADVREARSGTALVQRLAKLETQESEETE